MKKRIYKYDNVKALLIFLVVVGHMTTDYVSDSHIVRWVTLWIYMFHMPAFIFISGLVHKQYITEERANLGEKGETKLRLDKVLGFFLCGYTLKVFLQFTRTLMGQNPLWHWIEEPGIPWYLFVMAEYELLFYLLRHIDGCGKCREKAAADESAPERMTAAKTKVKGIRPLIVITGAFVLSAIAGYFPIIGDAFCLSRMINFLPIYALGYYIDMNKFLSFIEGNRYRTYGLTVGADVGAETAEIKNADKGKHSKYKAAAWIIIAVSLTGCYLAPWGWYSWRKWFTGRRTYEFLQDFLSFDIANGWWIRLAVWAVAIVVTLCVAAVIPDKDLGFITTIGARTLNVYFWHRPVCYLFRNWAVLPKLCVLFGGTYDVSAAGQIKGLAFGGSPWSMLAAFIVYLLIAAAMTAFFSMRIFEHPCADIMVFAGKIAEKRQRK